MIYLINILFSLNDELYKGLKSTKGYKSIHNKLVANFSLYCAQQKMKTPAITEKIMHMYYLDQYYQWVGSFKQRYPTAYAGLSKRAVDSLTNQTFLNNVQTLKSLIDKHGFLWHNEIGKDATHYIWLMVQDADHDLPFQKLYLKELESAVDKKNASGLDLAYLTDRIRKNEGEKQVYGTQMIYKVVDDPVKGKSSKMELWPVESPDDLDQRRKAVGLMPMEEYIQLMNKLNNRK